MDSIQVVDYFYVMTAHKPGVGAAMLGELRRSGVNLLAFTGFPSGRGAQIDFVPESAQAFRDVAKRAKWKVKGPKRAFLIAGEDRTGVVAELMTRLAEAKINVTAVDALCAGAGRYGAILWVAPRDVKKASQVLGVV